MNPKYKRYENEDEYEYGLRLIATKVEQHPDDLEWQDIVDLLGLNVHYDSLRKAANVTPYSGYSVMQHFKEKLVENVDVSSYMDEMDQKILEFQKERQKFFDQRREYKKLVIQDGRTENLEDRLVDAANRVAESVGKMDFDTPVIHTSDNEAILVLCDWHYGMHTDNIWNTYNVDICKQRVSHVVKSAIERIQLHQCNKLHIVVLGDLVHGAIHTSARVASEELVCDQIMNVSEVLAQSVEKLSQYVNETCVYMTYGNHVRTVQNKKDSIHRDNMERLIPWWMKQRLKDNENIAVMSDFDNELLVFHTNGYGFCASHGDLDSVKSSPKTLTMLLQKRMGIDIDYILLADKHHRESFEELGVNAMICGALCGTDEYANNKRLYSMPEQMLLIVAKGVGVDAEYRLKCG